MNAALRHSDDENSLRYPGWGVLAAAFTGVMVSFAPIVPYTFSLFLDPLHAAFGWKREAMGGAFALAAITVALVSPLIGILLDRFPPQPHHSSRDSGFRRRACRAQPIDAEYRSVLCHVFCDRAGGKCNRAIRVHAHGPDLVHDPQRICTRPVAYRQRNWLHRDSAAHRMDDRASRMAQRLSIVERDRHCWAFLSPRGSCAIARRLQLFAPNTAPTRE